MNQIPKDLSTHTRSELLEMADQTLYVLTRCKNYCTAYPSLPEGERDIHRLRATKRKRDHLKAEHQRILSELARRNKKMQMHQRFFTLVCVEIGEIRAMEIMEMAKNA